MASMSKAKPEKKQLPKRFYAAVEVVQQDAAFCITLDGKMLRTQGRHLLQVHEQPLAEAIAVEWEAQTQYIDPDTMPLTRLINLAIDRAAMDRNAWLDETSRYGETDLLCYRAPDVALKQAALFNPLLAWAAAQGVELEVTEGVMPITQPVASLTRLRSLFAAATNAELAALAMLTPLLGSAILALALWKRQITVEQALAAARIDEEFQAEKWGRDAEADAAWLHKCGDIKAAAFFLDMQATKISQ